MKSTRRKKLKRIAYTAVASTIAAGSLTVNNLYSSPSDIINGANMTYVPTVQADDDDDESNLKNNRNFKQKLKEAFSGLPLRVRAFIGIPLWFIGNGLNWALETMWSNIATPILNSLLSLFFNLLTLILCIIATVKLMFPNLKLKALLTKKNLIILLIGSMLLILTDYYCSLYIPSYKLIKWSIKILIGILIIYPIVKTVYKVNRKIHYTFTDGKYKIQVDQ